MTQATRLTLLLLLSLATLGACAHRVAAPVPPRVDLKTYKMLGIVEFTSKSNPAIGTRATREFQVQAHAAQPGTRIVELGTRDAVLATVSSHHLNVDALRKIGEKYGVDAIFLGDIAYSEAEGAVNLTDLINLAGGVRMEVRGDISARLVETLTGASVWSNSAWTLGQVGRLNLSVEQGVSGSVSSANPKEAMVPTLVYDLTQDFRPGGSVRQPSK